MGLEELEGQLIGGRFRLKAMVGKGGYGAVFEAIQLSVERRCAVKVLLPGRSMDDSVEQRFHSEARITSRLNHPNSVVLYDFGVDEELGYLFLATEFLDGKTLHEVMELRGELPVGAALSIMDQVAGSLGDAHHHGLVHRDVKLKNIMVVRRAGKADFVKVIDFGIAKALGGESDGQKLTRTGVLVGTPQYMAPEQLLGKAIDGRADQYALAVVGYRMLTGHNPFRADSAMETAMRHINDRPLPLRAYSPDLQVSEAFEEVFLKALEKSPEDRFHSIGAFVGTLKEAWEASPCDSDSDGGGVDLWQTVSPEVAQKQTLILDSGSSFDTATREVTSVDEQPSISPRPPTCETKDEILAPSGPARWVIVVSAMSMTAFIASIAVLLLALNSESPPVVEAQSIDDGPQALAAGDQELEEEEQWESRGADRDSMEVLAAALEAVDSGAAQGEERAGARARQIEERRVERRMEQRRRREPQKPGEVTVTLIPWGTLYVDGEPRSDQVRQALELAPGTYEMTLQQGKEIRARETVDVEAGQSKMVVLEARFDSETD